MVSATSCSRQPPRIGTLHFGVCLCSLPPVRGGWPKASPCYLQADLAFEQSFLSTTVCWGYTLSFSVVIFKNFPLNLLGNWDIF